MDISHMMPIYVDRAHLKSLTQEERQKILAYMTSEVTRRLTEFFAKLDTEDA